MPPRNAKRDEVAMRFTSFFVPHQVNTKNTTSTYLKNEAQTVWARNNTASSENKKRKRTENEEGDEAAIPVPALAPAEGRRGSQTIVIHPGARWLRIGRASDVYPISIPHILARKMNGPVPPPATPQFISRPRRATQKKATSNSEDMDVDPNAGGGEDYDVPVSATDDPEEVKISAIRQSLRSRMQFYKIKVLKQGSAHSSSFNLRSNPETIADHNDPYRVNWVTNIPADQEVVVGEKVFLLAEPHKKGYEIRWPFRTGKFNTQAYKSQQTLLSDVEAMWRAVLQEHFDISKKDIPNYNVILVIPDLFDRNYVRELVHLLLASMQFKQLALQQESLCAAYGAGISNACVIDMGATKTSVSCVDEGMVIADSRICLNVGGDDVTEMLHMLFSTIDFPYRSIDLGRSYDWNLMQELKERCCTLDETKVALNLYDFVIRKPGHPTQKFIMRAYDEPILAAMCVFEPRMIDFEAKKDAIKPFASQEVDEILESASDLVTHAMLISTQHLLVPPAIASPQPPSPSSQVFVPPPTSEGISIPVVPTLPQLPSSLPPPPNVMKTHTTPIVVLPPPPQLTHASSSTSVHSTTAAKESPPPSITPTSEPASSVAGTEAQPIVPDVDQLRPTLVTDRAVLAAGGPQSATPIEQPLQPSTGEQHVLPSRLPPIPTLFPPPPFAMAHVSTSNPPLDPDVRMASPPPQGSPPLRPNLVSTTMSPEDMIKQHFSNILPIPAGYKHVRPPSVYPGGYTIDVPLEASKLPLDVAIFNSARGSGGGAPGGGATGGAIGGHEDKVRKYLQAVLIVGGASRVPGMTGALESRLQAIATPLIPNMEKVQIIVPPKDIDPRVLCWKGASVLGRLDAVADLWVKPSDWDALGMRALRERTFFM